MSHHYASSATSESVQPKARMVGPRFLHLTPSSIPPLSYVHTLFSPLLVLCLGRRPVVPPRAGDGRPAAAAAAQRVLIGVCACRREQRDAVARRHHGPRGHPVQRRLLRL